MRRDALLDVVSKWALWFSLGSFALLFYRVHQFPAIGTDSLIYHLTIPTFWIQNGLLATPDLPFHDSAAEHSPALAEILYYVLLRLRGDESLSGLLEPAFLVVTFRWFYRSARLLGTGRILALLLTANLVYFRPFLEGVSYANNDLALTCGGAWMLYGLLLQRVKPQAGVLHASAGMALMLATKYVAVIYAAAALALWLLGTWRGIRPLRVRPSAGMGRGAIVAALLLLGAGSFFYVRNGLLWGNPFYPAEVKLLGVRVFSGLFDPSPLMDHAWSMGNLSRMFVHDIGPTAGFALRAPTSVFLWLGLLIAAASNCVRRGRRRGWWWGFAVTVAFPLVALFLFFLKVPFWREHRLLFPVYYALWLSLARGVACLTRLPWPRRGARTVAWLLLGSVVMQFVLTMGPRLERSFLAGELAGRSAAQIRRALYEERYAAQGKAWNLLRELTADDPAVIAYAGTALIFPLFGEDFKNRVLYIPLSEQDRAQPILLQPGESLYLKLARSRRRQADEAHWLGQLAQRGVDYLLLVDDPLRGGVEGEREMIARFPDRFALLFQEEGVYVYRHKDPE